ncbi:MAG: 30S ribosomal protein S4 [Methanoculleaceae archaeon]
MGYPGKNHKQYEKPKRRFEKTRIEAEKQIIIDYGLRNKREVWKAQSALRRFRRGARNILALMSAGTDPEMVERKKDELIGHLHRYGLLPQGADIDDVLALRIQQYLERRLQTIVYRKGLARSPKQARQLITHGHIAVNGRRVNIPGYLVTREEEQSVAYMPGSPFTSEVHPERSRIIKGGH